jgi:hypothetical protein
LKPCNGHLLTVNRHLTWRWCFYINLPIGAFTGIAVVLFLRLNSEAKPSLPLVEQVNRMDPLGLLFFLPSMVCLTLALQWGGASYAWSSHRVIGLLVTFAVTLVIFIVLEAWRPETALIPARIVMNRSIAGAMLYMLLLSGSMMVIIYYLTIWFQAAQGQSALESGIRAFPIMISMVVFSIPAAVSTEKIGYYNPVMLLSPVGCAVGAGLLSTLTPKANMGKWLGYQVIYGFGLGLGFQASTLPAQTVLQKSDVPVGTALMFFMQQLGGSIFVSVGQNLLTSKLVEGLSGIAGLDGQMIVNTGATELAKVVPKEFMGAVQQAYSQAITRVFIMAAALSAGMIIGALVLEWRSIKGKKAAEKDAEKETS